MTKTGLGLPGGIRTCLFDLDGVLTETARRHAKAWQQMFDEFLRRGDCLKRFVISSTLFFLQAPDPLFCRTST